eukprot:360329-Chlamydomonas_euryale.AAC.15
MLRTAQQLQSSQPHARCTICCNSCTHRNSTTRPCSAQSNSRTAFNAPKRPAQEASQASLVAPAARLPAAAGPTTSATAAAASAAAAAASTTAAAAAAAAATAARLPGLLTPVAQIVRQASVGQGHHDGVAEAAEADAAGALQGLDDAPAALLHLLVLDRQAVSAPQVAHDLRGDLDGPERRQG